MRMVAALDAGPVYAQAAVPIGNDETAADLHDRLAALGAEQIVAAVPRIVDGSMSATPQDPAGVSYAPKIAKADGRLDWRDSAVSLARKVRAFNPWPVAESGLDDGRSLRIWLARALDEPAGAAPGTIVAADADGIVVATGDGRLRIDSVQAPGARRMTVRDYLNAHALIGHRFVG
jgi:methionyl-tRNA formyltransferase